MNENNAEVELKTGETPVEVKVGYDELQLAPPPLTSKLEQVFGDLPRSRFKNTGRILTFKITDDATAITTGDGKFIFEVPQELDGARVTYVRAFVSTVSSSGAPSITIYNLTNSADILSTALTIDASEYTSDTAATAAVIDQRYNLFTNRDRVEINIDAAGTGAKGLLVYITVQ